MKTILRLAGLSALCVSAVSLAQEAATNQLVLSPAEMDGVTAGTSLSVAAGSGASAYGNGLWAVAGAATSSDAWSGTSGLGRNMFLWDASSQMAVAIAFGVGVGGVPPLLATSADGFNQSSGPSVETSTMREFRYPNMDISIQWGGSAGLQFLGRAR